MTVYRYHVPVVSRFGGNFTYITIDFWDYISGKTAGILSYSYHPTIKWLGVGDRNNDYSDGNIHYKPTYKLTQLVSKKAPKLRKNVLGGVYFTDI